jgi:predicted house-cleaning noncanonical NTP pyrophosphatase (MazG superfamily)
MKEITICNKKYPIDCNAFTRFQYKEIFGKGIFSDIKILNQFSEQQKKIRQKLENENKSEEEIQEQLNYSMMDSLDDFIDVIEKIAYILIYTANPEIESFEKWLINIEKIDLSSSWISEVTELAVTSFC